jgi:hypothetical protein
MALTERYLSGPVFTGWRRLKSTQFSLGFNSSRLRFTLSCPYSASVERGPLEGRPKRSAKRQRRRFDHTASPSSLFPLPPRPLLPLPQILALPMPKSRPLRPFAIMTNSQGKHNPSPGIGAGGGGPPSPTFTETTNVSAVNLGENGPAKIITRSDLKASMQSYENVSPSLWWFDIGKLKLIYVPPAPGPFFPFPHTTKHALALEFMFQFPICTAHNVPGYRRVRGLYGILRRVCVVLRSTNFHLSVSHLWNHRDLQMPSSLIATG